MATLLNRWKCEYNGQDCVGTNDGTVTGTFITTNPKEGAYSLNTRSYITATSLDSIITSATAKFSISFWIRSSTSSQFAESFFFSTKVAPHTNIATTAFYCTNTGGFKVVIRDTGLVNTNTWDFTLSPSISSQTTTWHNFILTYDYSEVNLVDRLKCYQNGSALAVAGTLTSLSAIGSNTGPIFQISDDYFYYYLDDFRFYSGVLSSAERAAIVTTTKAFSSREYQIPVGSTSYTLLFWYKGTQTEWGMIAKIGELPVYLGTPGNATFIGLGNNSVEANIKTVGSKIENGSWHLIALQNTAGVFKVAVDNGAYSSTFSAPDANLYDLSKTNKIQIGGNKTFDTYDVRLYNKALTIAQIDYYYTETAKTNPAIWEY